MFWNFEIQTQIGHFWPFHLPIDFSKMAIYVTFQNRVIRRTLSVFLSRFLHRSTLIAESLFVFLALLSSNPKMKTNHYWPFWLCKMSNFQNAVISRILSVFLSRLLLRMTVMQNGVIFLNFKCFFCPCPVKYLLCAFRVIFCITFGPRNSATW